MPVIKIGEIFSTNCAGDLKILKVDNCDRIYVMFITTGFCRYSKACHIRLGKVKDPYHISVLGVGYFGEGDHKSKINKKVTPAYRAWKNMLSRCYCEDYLKKHPTYIGCSVCDSWLNFQTFAKWFDNNHIEGSQLDKDTVQTGNKVYSPDTCVYITGKENTQAAFICDLRLISSQGEIVEVPIKREFALLHNLDPSALSKLCKGTLKAVKGWRLYVGE